MKPTKGTMSDLERRKTAIIAGLRGDGTRLADASEEERADPEIVRAAVTENGYVLDWAAPQFRGDKATVLAAVKSCGGAIQYASPVLRADKEVVLTAARTFNAALWSADDSLFNDPDVRDHRSTSVATPADADIPSISAAQFVAKAAVINERMVSEVLTARHRRGSMPANDRQAWVAAAGFCGQRPQGPLSSRQQKRRQEHAGARRRKQPMRSWQHPGELLSDDEADRQWEMEMAREAQEDGGSAEEEEDTPQTTTQAQPVAEVKDDGEPQVLDEEQSREYEALWATYMVPRRETRAPCSSRDGSARTLRPGRELPPLLCELPTNELSLLGKRAHESLQVLKRKGCHATVLAKLQETFEWQIRQSSVPVHAPAFLRRRPQQGELVERYVIDLEDDTHLASAAIDVDTFPFREDAELHAVPKLESETNSKSCGK